MFLSVLETKNRKTERKMGSLVEVLKDNNKRNLVLDDCELLLDAEVSDKKGFSGVAVKGAFKILKRFKSGMIRYTMNDMIDEFALKIDPFWLECQNSGQDAKTFFVSKKVAVADALLSITDERAKVSPNKGIKKAYNGLRPKAVQYIGDAMPRLAGLIQKHAS
jgi:hypothetical protein